MNYGDKMNKLGTPCVKCVNKDLIIIQQHNTIRKLVEQKRELSLSICELRSSVDDHILNNRINEFIDTSH